MEQKKTLWIIAAVGTFLLVALGTAGVIYSPSKAPTPVVTTASSKTDKPKNSGWTNTTSDNSSNAPLAVENSFTSPQEVNDMVVVSKNTTILNTSPELTSPETETTIDLNALKSEPVVQPQNINITVTLPETESKVVQVPVPVKSEKTENKVYVPNVQPPKNTTPVATPAPAKTVQKKATPAKQTTKQPVATTKKAAPKKVTQYWVQVGSYSNKKGAENAKTILDENKISSDIFTFEDKKDKLYYRVRIGPYTTKSEAEYWKARVLKITYFENNDSYITSTVK